MDRPEMVFPETIEAALAALRARGARALAGGTDVIPAMQRGEISPRVLVNLKRIPELRGVRRTRRGLRIGATTRLWELLADPAVAQSYPLLVDTASAFASVQIRNLATIGGNLCNAAPSADLALPLLALEAWAEVHGPRGAREVPLADFFRGVNRTALARGEVLAAVHLPRPRGRAGGSYAKLMSRGAMDLAMVGAAALIELTPEGRRCRRARLALGAVAPTPMRARQAEAVLEGRPITKAALEEAARAAAGECQPISDLRASAEYRRAMVRVLARRTLAAALVRAGKERRG